MNVAQKSLLTHKGRMPPIEASSPSLAKIEAASPPGLPPLVEMRHPPGTGPAPAACANCYAALQGPYCSQCGQHVADFHRSLLRFVGEFFDNVICWDNKFLRTLGPLLTQPGVLTREFMAGRRVRYVQPLRLFLFVSAVCLTLMQFHQGELVYVRAGTRGKKKNKPHADITFGTQPSATPVAASGDDDDKKNPDDATPGDAKAIADGIRQEVPTGKKDGTDVSDQIDKAVAAKVAAAGGAEKFGQQMTKNVQQRLSWVALAMLPLFALLLQATYWRRKSYYFEHLIFSLHYHTFLLLFWTLSAGWGVIVNATFLLRWMSPLNVVLLLVPGVYLYLALQRVYGGSTLRTVVKVVVIGAIHLLALLIGVASVGALAMFMAGK